MLFVLLTLIKISHSFDYFELWSIEQLDDMILSDAWKKTVPARTPAIIGLYETECENKIRNVLYSEDVHNAGFPNSLHLIFAAFDRKHVKNEIWFKWNEKLMDPFYRYNITTSSNKNIWCPTFIFQPANWSMSPIIYDKNSGKSFVDWVWDMIKVNVKFINNLDKTINVVIETNQQDNQIGSDIILTTIEKDSEQNIDVHASDIITIKDTEGNVLNRHVINTIELEIEIKITKDSNILDISKLEKSLKEKYDLRVQRDWSTRRRYLNNIRTPQVMPAFTKMGFLHKKMPDKICKYLKKFYNDNKNKAQKESFPRDGTQINAREIPTYMMHIPYQKKLWISNILQKDLEKWAKKKLQHVTIYGIREYKNGAVLKGHVDRIETHIISAILHVNHEPKNISWPLEVVGFDGKVYNIEDNECDLVYYESSKLIHGRPTTYKGNSWSNAFLHFKPADWTGYEFTPENMIITPNQQRPLVDFRYG